MVGREHAAPVMPLGDLLLSRSLDEDEVGRATESTPDYPILPGSTSSRSAVKA